MALTAPDPDNDYIDNPYERDEDNLRGSRTNSRVGFVDLDNPMYDDTGQRLGGRVPSRTSTFGRRTSRQPLPREFRDNAYDVSQEDDLRLSRQQSLDGSITEDSGVDVSSGRSASRASGQVRFVVSKVAGACLDPLVTLSFHPNPQHPIGRITLRGTSSSLLAERRISQVCVNRREDNKPGGSRVMSALLMIKLTSALRTAEPNMAGDKVSEVVVQRARLGLVLGGVWLGRA